MNIDGNSIEFLGHSGFLVSIKNGKRIAIDPYNVSDAVGKVDLILITHSHYDHCSIKDIEKISREGTTIVVPPDGQSKITRINGIDMQLVEAGDVLEFGSIKIEAFPAYNKDKQFHPKSEGWVGYLVKLNGTTIYHSGDSDKIPEMSNLSGYGKKGHNFIALLPVSGTYVMTADEAAEAASLINPTIAIPMHYGAGVVGTREDAERFLELCKKTNVHAQILEKI